MKQYIFVITQLVSREMKRKYARSSLGIIWSVLNPLLSMAVISFVFSQMFARNIENFPIYYLTGSLLWSLFTGATNAAMTTLVDNKSLLIKTKLPMEIFPLTRTITSLVNFGYSMIAYIIMLFIFQIPFQFYMPLFFLYAIGLFFFSLGVGYLLSVLYVYFGDIKHLYSVLLSLLMFMTAIFYPVEATPVEVQSIIKANPIYNYISSARKCILDATFPNTEEWIRMIVWSVGMYAFGKIVFKKMQNKVFQKI